MPKHLAHSRSALAGLLLVLLGIAGQSSSILQAAAADTLNYLLSLGNHDHEPAAPVQFYAPQGVAYDTGGRLYVSDTEWEGTPGHRVQVFDTNYHYLHDVVPTTPFSSPIGLAVDDNGVLVVADGDNSRLVFFTTTAGGAAQVDERGVFGNYDPEDGGLPGPIPLDVLNYPTGVALKPGTKLLTGDAAGRLAVADTGNHRIVVYGANLAPLYQVGGHSIAGIESPGTLQYPFGVAIDAAGLIYVADTDNSRVQVFREIVTAGQPSAQLVRVFGSEFNPLTFEFSSNPGDLSRPYGLSFDSLGRLLVSDTDNHRILRIDVTRDLAAPTTSCRLTESSQTEHYCTVTTSDRHNYEALVLGTRGLGHDALFTYPQLIVESPVTHALAVADTQNHMVQIFGAGRLSVVFSGTDSIAAGAHPLNQAFPFSVGISNNGSLPATVTLTAVPSRVGVLTTPGSALLAPGETRSFTFTFLPKIPGPLSFLVSASAAANVMVGGHVDVGTRSLDAGTVDSAVGLSTLATASTASGGVGDPLSVVVRLTNTGPTTLTNVRSTIAIDNPARLQAVGSAPAATTLPPLGSVDLVYNYTMVQAGSVVLTVSGSAEYINPLTPSVVQPLSDTASPLTITISNDVKAPVTTLTTLPLPASGWYRVPLPITLTAADEAGGSGVAAITYRVVQDNLPQTIPGNTVQFVQLRQGVSEIRYRARDNAGNVEVERSLIVKQDTVPPDMGAPQISSAVPPTAGWYRTNPTITFIAGDSAGGSGLATLTPPVTITTNGANQTRTGVAVDTAGNRSIEARATVSVDTLAPVLVCVPSRLPNGNLWYSSSVSVYCAAVDQAGLSGLKSVRAMCHANNLSTGAGSAFCTYTADGVYTFLGEATDVAGNLATQTFTVRVDRTPPVLTCSANASAINWPANHKMATWKPVVTVSDNTSGATFKLTAYYSNADNHHDNDDDDRDHDYDDMSGWTLNTPDTSGAIRVERDNGRGRIYTLKYKATDLAGNYAYCSVSVTVPREKGSRDDRDRDERDHEGHYCDDRSHGHRR